MAAWDGGGKRGGEGSYPKYRRTHVFIVDGPRLTDWGKDKRDRLSKGKQRAMRLQHLEK